MKMLTLLSLLLAGSLVHAADAPAAKPAETQTAYTLEEVAKHNRREDCWFVVRGKVYDVTPVIPKHDGGEKPILNNCGKDATQAFENRGGKGPHSAKAQGFLAQRQVGVLKN